jgi:hypothetical protein
MTNQELIADELDTPPTTELRFDELVSAFIDTRDVIKAIEERYKEELKKPYRLKALLTERLLDKLKATGQAAARTEYGTVTAVVHTTVSCSDPNAFVDYVREHDAFELMDRRANKTACEEFLKNTGELPPGVKINRQQDVNVLRAKPKDI